MEDKILKCFEKISEADLLKTYRKKLNSFEDEDVSEFGFLQDDRYVILKLDRSRNDALLRYSNGSSDFLLRYNNELYLGNWSEGQYNTSDTDLDIEDYCEVYHEFMDDMKAQGVKIFYTCNF